MYMCSGLILRVASLLPRCRPPKNSGKVWSLFPQAGRRMVLSHPRDRCVVSPLIVDIFTLQLTWLIFLVAGDKENDYNKWRIFVYRYGSTLAQ